MHGVAWRIHREVVVLLGWGSAILMQFAHPLVARGVADHSGFRQGPMAPWRRLHRTLGAMLALSFGTEAEVAETARRINRVHDRVHGSLPVAEGPHPAGTRYSARDPALLTWVHATCLLAFLRAYELFVEPLTEEERDRYCAETSAIEPLLGIPAGTVPRSHRALEAYVAEMVDGGPVAVAATARSLAADLLNPPLVRFVLPVVWLFRLTAVGLLPPALREAYGFRWDRRRETALRTVAFVVRALLPLVPPPLRYWPAARRAVRRMPAAPGALATR